VRDPDRIDKICDKLKEYWHRAPDWRLGQIISNSTDPDDDLFYIEDDELMDNIEHFFRNHGEEQHRRLTQEYYCNGCKSIMYDNDFAVTMQLQKDGIYGETKNVVFENIDIAVKILDECHSHVYCRCCPYFTNHGSEKPCDLCVIARNTVATVGRNHKKTFCEDYFEKHPYATKLNERPLPCRYSVYSYAKAEDCRGKDCKDCWNEPYYEPEEQKCCTSPNT
jgi:hypothetical protein